MPYTKNVLILKQLEKGFSPSDKPLSGIVRIECDSGVTELSLSLVNLSAIVGGEYFLYIFASGDKVYTFGLGSRPTNLRKTLDSLDGTTKGFACALVALKSDIPLTVAFGKTENFNITLSNAKKLIAEKCLADRRLSSRKTEPIEIEEPSKPTPPPLEVEKKDEKILDEQSERDFTNTAYNDEAVATENYFELDEQIKNKLDKINGWDNDNISNANGKTTNLRQEKKEENSNGADFLQDEENLFSGESKEELPFYVSAERELNALFEKFPPYENLLGFFPDSKWVKINYDQKHYYIVGVIKENKKEKYICYGVPANYSPEPPKELKGYCTFIPLSIFDMQGEGFWIMFQDAITGESITPKQ